MFPLYNISSLPQGSKMVIVSEKLTGYNFIYKIGWEFPSHFLDPIYRVRNAWSAVFMPIQPYTCKQGHSKLCTHREQDTQRYIWIRTHVIQAHIDKNTSTRSHKKTSIGRKTDMYIYKQGYLYVHIHRPGHRQGYVDTYIQKGSEKQIRTQRESQTGIHRQ